MMFVSPVSFNRFLYHIYTLLVKYTIEIIQLSMDFKEILPMIYTTSVTIGAMQP